MKKPVVVSGIQPSGRLHIGNYLGALKNFVALQESKKYECYFSIADLHALTEPPYDAKTKSALIIDLAASFLAAGLDPKKSALFIQSRVLEHAHLAWILNTITPVGELERMTQYKEKSARSGASAGLFTYPVLMASDILLYDGLLVPVGNDQDQHLELSRTLARRFNSRFKKKIFSEPKALYTEAKRVMSLDDPQKKMSKSAPKGCLFLDDDEPSITKKIMAAVTDSGKEVELDPANKPGISNLLNILSELEEKPVQEIQARYKNKNYGQFKLDAAKIISEKFASFRQKKASLLKNPASLLKKFSAGEKLAKAKAAKKIEEVKIAIGLL